MHVSHVKLNVFQKWSNLSKLMYNFKEIAVTNTHFLFFFFFFLQGFFDKISQNSTASISVLNLSLQYRFALLNNTFCYELIITVIMRNMYQSQLGKITSRNKTWGIYNVFYHKYGIFKNVFKWCIIVLNIYLKIRK